MFPRNLPLVSSTVVILFVMVLLISSEATAASPALNYVKSWAYQIQDQEVDGNLQKLADSHYDLLVIDETRSIAGLVSYDMKGAVSLLHASLGGNGRSKLVLAYMDIGEAESYRWYWRSGWSVGSPDWIVAPDPDGWAGNYPVLFWRPTWKSILYGSSSSYLDKALADGFDGIYLDWIEAATFDPVVSAAARESKDPRAEMVTLVSQLAAYGRAQKPGFLVIPQNALDLARPTDATTKQYLSTIDGIGQEGVWFDGSSNPTQQQGDLTSNYTAEALQDLSIFQAAGKPVFTIDYAQKPDHVAYAYAQAAAHGFREYVTLRQLDSLSTTPPPSYPVPEFKSTITLILIFPILLVPVLMHRRKIFAATA